MQLAFSVRIINRSVRAYRSAVIALPGHVLVISLSLLCVGAKLLTKAWQRLIVGTGIGIVIRAVGVVSFNILCYNLYLVQRKMSALWSENF